MFELLGRNALANGSEAVTFGEKAFRLWIMSQTGLAVPSGFAVSAEATRSHETSLNQLVVERAHRIDAPYGFAVRSSAIGEDSLERSFAGIYESRLAVSFDELPMAFELVRDSFYSQRAKSYRSHATLDSRSQGMGIIVQRMVSPHFSGVLFTTSPISEEEEMIIESVVGLGESLVSGRINPTVHEVNRKTRSVKLVQSQWWQGNHEDSQAGANNTTGIRMCRQAPNVLATSQLDDLVTVAFRIEALFGAAQDIEFAFDADGLQILQTRPITSPPITFDSFGGNDE